MKILALETQVDGVTAEDFDPHVKAEAFRVWELYHAGIIRESYFRADRSNAVLVLECASVGEANEILNTLPLAKEGLIGFEVIPLAPYPGFSRLFAQ